MVVAAVPPTSTEKCYSDGAVFTTSDGGTTWSQVTTVGCTALEDVACLSADTCEATGLFYPDGPSSTEGEVLGTTDGGATWTPQGIVGPMAPTPVYKLKAHTTLTSISCTSASFCVAVGLSAYHPVVESTDGGGTWVKQEVPLSIPNRALNGVTCPSVDHCEVVGDEDSLVTSDGSNWYHQTVPPGFVNGVACPSQDECLAVGTGPTNTGAVILHFP